MLAFMLAMIDRVSLGLIVDPIQRDLGISDTTFGLLNGAAFAAPYLIMSIPIARLADRGSRRLIIACGIMVWSAATFLSGLSTTATQLLICRIFVGAGESALVPASYSMLSSMFRREELGRAFGLFHAGALIGSGISLVISGAIMGLVERGPPISLPHVGDLAGWQVLLFVIALPGLLMSVLMFTVREPRRSTTPEARSIDASRSRSAGLGAHVRQRWLFLVLYLLSFACIGAVIYGSLAWLPSVLTRGYGLDHSATGLALGVAIGIGSPLGALSGGLLADRLVSRGRREAPIIVGLVGAAGALVLVVWAPMAANWQSCIVLTGALFFCLTLPSAAGPAGLQMITPEPLRAQITAIYVVATGLVGMSVGSFAIGFLTDNVFQEKADVGSAIAAFGGASMLLMAVTLVLVRKMFVQMNAASEDPAISGGG